MKKCLSFLIAVILLFLCSPAIAQSWVTIDTFDFENTNIDTGINAATVIHTSPQTYAARSGTRGLYMNVQNTATAGSLLYHRSFPTCIGEQYRLAFYYASRNSGVQANVNIRVYDGNTLIDNINTGSIPFSWQFFNSSIITTTSNFIRLEIYTNINGSPSGNDLGVDDMTLKVMAKSYSKNITMCNYNLNKNLFDSIPVAQGFSNSGTWSGPSALSNGYLGTFNGSTNVAGTYTYSIGGARCASVATLNVSLYNCNAGCATLTVSNDTAVCSGQQVRLNAQITGGTIVSQSWSPSWGLSNPNIANPLTTVTVDTQYVYTVTATSNTNVIVNGDFNTGNSGFSSAYTYVNNTTNPPPSGCTTWGLLSCPGYYTITTNPSLGHNNFSSFGDHTTGSGNMLVCNGATNANIAVWCQTIPVIPNTTYNFSAWVSNVDPFSSSTSLADLRFQVNSVQIGTQFSPVLSTGVWTQFNATWNSGSNTSANICIMNQSLVGGGNDFAIDDIYFSPICTLKDTVKVTAKKAPTVLLGNDTAICLPINQLLSPTVSGTAPLNYLWQDASTATTYNATGSGNFWCRVTNQCGVATDSINIAALASPTINLGSDTTFCNTVSKIIRPTITGSSPIAIVWNDASVADTLVVNSPGTYWATVSNSCGSATDSVTINLLLSPTVSLPNDTTFCDIIIKTIHTTTTGSLPISYLWNNGSIADSLVVNTAGTYWVAVSNSCGNAADTMTISLLHSPSVMLGNDSVYCNKTNVVLQPIVTGSTPISYLWQDNSAANSYTASVSGLYSLTVSNSCNTARDTVAVILKHSPTVDVGNAQQLICNQNSYTISSTVVSDTTYSIVWQDGSSTATYTATSAGTFTAVVANMCGSAADSIILSFEKTPAVSFSNDTFATCETPVTLSPAISNTANYTLLWNDNDTVATKSAANTGWYSVSATNNCGTATDSTYVNIIHYPTPIYMGQTLKNCPDEMIVLDAENIGATYLWSNNLTTQTISVSDTGIYKVLITNDGLCSILDSVFIINKNCTVSTIYMPTAFTPNGDSKNDVIFPFYNGNVKIISFKVYNRWGELVHNTIDPNGWDGAYHGEPQPVGVYVYYLEYLIDGQSKYLKGTITLIK